MGTYPSDDEVKIAFKKFDDKEYRIAFKLLAFLD